MAGRTLRLRVALVAGLALAGLPAAAVPAQEPARESPAPRTGSQPQGALFDESAAGERPMTRGWLYAGLYVLAGLVCGAACAYLAVARALPPARWFVAGLVGNVVGLAVLLSRPPGDSSALPQGVPPGLAKVATTREPLACPACGAANHPAAAACATCGAALHPTVRSETASAS